MRLSKKRSCWGIPPLLLCCVLVSAASSSNSRSSLDTATLRSLGLTDADIDKLEDGTENEDDQLQPRDEEEEPWKANNEWWKDPLAMFSDDDEDVASADVEQNDLLKTNDEETLVEENNNDKVETNEGNELVIGEDSSKEPEPTPDPVPIETKSEAAVETPPKEIPKLEEAKGPEAKEPPVTKIGRERMPSGAEARLAENAMVPKTTPSMTTVNFGSSLSAPLALLLPAIPQFRHVMGLFPAAKLVFCAVVARILVPVVMDKLHFSPSQYDRLTEGDDNDEDDFREEASVEEVSETSTGERIVRITQQKDRFEESILDRHEGRPTDESLYKARLISKRIPSKTPKWLQRFMKNVFHRDSNTERIPPAPVLLQQVEELKKKARDAECERDLMEKEYEETSFQLQEAQTELATLTSTTRYLKAQLRDNEEVMNRALRAERSKAKAELTRMKDAMLNVLEKERRAMRTELKRQTEEIQALLQSNASKSEA